MHKFNPYEPTGPLENRWEKHLFDLALIAPQNRKKYNIIELVQVLLAHPWLLHWVRQVTISSHFVITIAQEEPIQLLPKVELMQARITRVTATALGAFFMTQ